MQKFYAYGREHAVHLAVFVAIIALGTLGVVDPGTAAAGMLLGGIALDTQVITPEQIKELKALTDTLTKKSGEMAEVIEKGRAEVVKFETLTGKTNEKLTEVSTEAKAAQDAVKEFKTLLTDIEQKIAKKPGGNDDAQARKSAGELFVESQAYKDIAAKGFRGNSDSVAVPSLAKTALLNTAVGGTNPQPLVVNERVGGIIHAGNRRFTIRDLLPQMRTTSNLIEFTTETFTNNAGPQFSSPNDRENVLKAESAFSFALSNAPVITLAHWLPVSRQLMADAVGLGDYLNQRLMYGLKIQEEAQLLTGDSTGGNLSGLNTGATAYNRSVSNDTPLDALLRSMLQVTASEYAASGFVLHPIDWFGIQLLKDTQGRYIFTNPQDVTSPRLWGLPVVATNSQTAGTFLTGAFDLAAAIWDREDANIRYSDNYSDYFVRNMIAILVEERLALVTYRATALIKGTLPLLPIAGGT